MQSKFSIGCCKFSQIASENEISNNRYRKHFDEKTRAPRKLFRLKSFTAKIIKNGGKVRKLERNNPA